MTPQISPSGRFVAHISDETGRGQVAVDHDRATGYLASRMTMMMMVGNGLTHGGQNRRYVTESARCRS
jgi:hypothetical protein